MGDDRVVMTIRQRGETSVVGRRGKPRVVDMRRTCLGGHLRARRRRGSWIGEKHDGGSGREAEHQHRTEDAESRTSSATTRLCSGHRLPPVVGAVAPTYESTTLDARNHLLPRTFAAEGRTRYTSTPPSLDTSSRVSGCAPAMACVAVPA